MHINESKVEEFFDSLAPTWDDKEFTTIKEKKALLDNLDIHQGDKVIDIACGTGVITNILHSYSEAPVLGIDLSEEMIKRAKEKNIDRPWNSFRHIDVMNLPEDKKYDYAVIYNAYPHFASPKALSKKLSHILNPNGHFAIVHSMSRHALSSHHNAIASHVSRDLDPIVEEAKYFQDEFNIEMAYEDDHSIIIKGKLKS